MDRMEAREQLQEICSAGLKAVDPYWAVCRAVKREEDTLFIGKRSYALEDYDRIFVIGAGKAGAPMSKAMEDLVGDRLSAGLISVKYGHGMPLKKVEIAEAAHPVPDEKGIEATERIVAVARQAGERDLVFCLISGGGSALLVAPAKGIGLGEIQEVTSELLSCGASIGEINALRKHLSQVKGGQ